MATQPGRKRGSAVPATREYVMASVRLDVATSARVAAAAALAGLDKSAWMNRAIQEALSGVVVIDRRNPKGLKPADPDTGEDRQDATAA